MDLVRQLEFFNPETVNDEVHIIGIGAIGSHIAEMLVRMGITKLSLYDFDTVDDHNIPNQLYRETDIGKLKTDAMLQQLKDINSRVDIRCFPEGWKPGQNLDGYIFLCVDSIETRKLIVQDSIYNPLIKGMFDFRMGLESAQHYAADWTDTKAKDKLIRSMNFTSEEAKEAMPVSACGSALCVLPTIRMVTAAGIANWMNMVKTNKYNTYIEVNAFKYLFTTF